MELTNKFNAAYESVRELDLPPCSSLTLSVALNYANFKYESVKDHAGACQVAESAFQAGLDQIEELEEEEFREAKALLELLKENLTLWKEEEEGDDQIDDL